MGNMMSIAHAIRLCSAVSAHTNSNREKCQKHFQQIQTYPTNPNKSKQIQTNPNKSKQIQHIKTTDTDN